MPNYTLLLIDYEPRSIDRLRKPLEHAGFRVEVARDGLAGIARFQSIKPDLTLVEAMLPKKHGFEVCQELKRTPHGQKSKVLIVTSVYKGRKYQWQAKHAYGCDDYLEKPISDEALVAAVCKHLGATAPVASEPAAPTAHHTQPPANPPAPKPAPPSQDADDVIELDLDAQELDLSDHIDTVLSGRNSRQRNDPSASVEPAEAVETNVVPFDLDRRFRPGDDSRGGVHSRSRGGAQPALRPEPDPAPTPSPRAEVGPSPGDPEATRPGQGSTLRLWIAFGMLVLLGAGLLGLVYLL